MLPILHRVMCNVTCLTYGNVYVSMLLSQIILPSLSPTVSPCLFSNVCVSIAALQIDSSVPSLHSNLRTNAGALNADVEVTYPGVQMAGPGTPEP